MVDGAREENPRQAGRKVRQPGSRPAVHCTCTRRATRGVVMSACSLVACADGALCPNGLASLSVEVRELRVVAPPRKILHSSVGASDTSVQTGSWSVFRPSSSRRLWPRWTSDRRQAISLPQKTGPAAPPSFSVMYRHLVNEIPIDRMEQCLHDSARETIQFRPRSRQPVPPSPTLWLLRYMVTTSKAPLTWLSYPASPSSPSSPVVCTYVPG